MRNEFIFGSILISIGTTAGAYFYFPVIYLFVIWIPLIILGVIDLNSKRHTIVANYPLFGRFRYVMEELRPKIYQYFIESDTDGTPINRVSRSVVYQRAKKQLDTTPFGTQLDIYKPGYEWINHSITPLALDHLNPDDLRIDVGGKDCSQPYSLSLLVSSKHVQSCEM